MSRLSRCLAGVALSALLSGSALAEEPALAAAAGQHDAAAVTALLKAGAPVNLADENGATALAWAAQYQDAALVQTLLQAGADANLVNDYGVGPLLAAARLGDAAVTRLLLAGGADPNRATWNGETPLMHAARAGSVEAVDALLKAGAQVDARETRDGQTALMWAAAAARPDVVRALLAAKADRSIRTLVFDVEYADNRENVAARREPRKEKQGGYTALLFAVQSGDEATAKALLDAGEDANQASASGASALLLASYRHGEAQREWPGQIDVSADLEMVDLLLAAGADPNKADALGVTPLHATVWVATGYDLSTSPVTGRPRIFPHEDMAAALATKLLARGANPNLMISDYLVPSPKGQDTRSGGRFVNVTPVMLAAALGKARLVDLMVGSGRVDAKARLSNGSTPLISAAKLNNLVGVKGFIRAGADVNAADATGDTALHLVARGGPGTGPIAEALLAAGARLDLKNAAGRTALDIATVEGSGVGPAGGGRGNRGGPVGVEPAVQLGGGGGGPGGGQATPVPEAGEVIKQAAAKPPLKGRTAAVAPRTGSQVANAAR